MGCLSSVAKVAAPIAGAAIGSTFGMPSVGASIGNMAGNLFSSGGKSVSGTTAPNVYSPGSAAMQSANTSLIDLVNKNIANNPIATVNPQLQGLLTSVFNSPYATGAQTAANTAGQALTTAGGAAGAGATGLNTAAQNVLNTAFDPQSALYNRAAQQLQDQIRVGQAARGITTSGYGAGLENEAMANFNIDWQNQQLARMLSGLSGATEGYTGANALATQGAQNLYAGGQLPQTTYMSNLTGQGAAAGDIANIMTGANTVNQQSINDLLNYLGYGTSTTGQQIANYGNVQQDYANQQNAIADVIKGLFPDTSATKSITSGVGNLGKIIWA